VDSDGGNNALQGWDLLHGHLLLHGWQIGDANFYFLELPLNAVTEALFGRYDARFVVADPSQMYPPGILKYPPAVFERLFGKPATTYRVDGWTILVYRTNLLRLLAPS
jgi:hypothetical protein